VWETHKVHGETNQSWFITFFTFFSYCLLTTKLHQDTHATHSTHCSPPMWTLSPLLTLVLAPATQSLPICLCAHQYRHSEFGCDEVIGVPHHQLSQPNSNICYQGQWRSKHPMPGQMAQCVLNTRLNSLAKGQMTHTRSKHPMWGQITDCWVECTNASSNGIAVGLERPILPIFLPSQYCMVVSFDIHNAIARFPGWFEFIPAHGLVYPQVSWNPYPDLLKPLPLVAGMGLHR